MLRAAALLIFVPLWTYAEDGATVQGAVTNSATQAGLSGVSVTLWTQQAVHYNATTDDTGAWRISGMKPGRYYSRFEKSGFIEPPHESPLTDAPLSVGTGGPPIQLDAQLVPLATLRGRVLEPDGKPAADVEIESGAFASVKTDEDGQFTLNGVRPGSYTLKARRKPVENVPKEASRIEIVPTYYPSAIDVAEAAKVVVRGGEDLSGFEIRLRSSPVYRVRGMVLDETGEPLPNASVQLRPRSGGSLLTGQMTLGNAFRYFFTGQGLEKEEAATASAADGTFEFPSVRPGDWVLSVETEPRRDSAKNLTFARTDGVEARVTDHDLVDLRIRFPETFTLQAALDWGDTPPPKLDPRVMVTLLLIPAGGGGLTLPRMGIRAEDRLRYENITAGRYRIVPMPLLVPGYYLAGALLAGQDVLGQEVELNPATPVLRLQYRPNASTVRGIVDKGEGATVLFWPPSAGAPDLVRAVQAGAGGAFEFSNVAPGDYFVMAVDRQNLESRLEALIRDSASSATRVHVDEGSSPSVSLPLTHVAE